MLDCRRPVGADLHAPDVHARALQQLAQRTPLRVVADGAGQAHAGSQRLRPEGHAGGPAGVHLLGLLAEHQRRRLGADALDRAEAGAVKHQVAHDEQPRLAQSVQHVQQIPVHLASLPS